MRSESRRSPRSPPRNHKPHEREHDRYRERDRDEERHGKDKDRDYYYHRERRSDRSKDKDRDRSASPERKRDLPKGVNSLSESDYFQKSDEFRLWLKEEKRKYFDELSGDKARSYFRKFVKVWNRGSLSHKYYQGLTPGSLPATTNTSYKWSFASQADDKALRTARAEVGAATYNRDVRYKSQANNDDGSPSATTLNSGGVSSSRPSVLLQGPTLPTSADITYARELVASQRAEERAHQHSKNKKETKEHIEDLVGPKLVGREGMLEKKALRREGDRAFRERGDEGLEVDESTLMGGGDGFKAMIARRVMSKRRHEHKQEERVIAIRERASAMKEKEKATMDMFQQLAKQRFG